MAPDVSICVATHLRPEGLARLLESLARLKLPGDLALEVLVVDNDPEGSAARVAARFADFAHPLRWLQEPRRNIAHARNRALAEAAGRWLAFIDDDEVADERWIAAYWERLGVDDCDGFFGPVLPRLERVVTAWLDVESFYARPRHATGSALGLADLRTGNAFLARRLFEGRAFDPAFGRSGGSDLELFGRMHEAGARFCWCDEARVTEFVEPQRHRLGWLSRRSFRGGVTFTRRERRRAPLATLLRRLPRATLALGALLLVLPFAALRGRATAARVWLRICVQAGHLWALAGRSYEEYGG